MTTPPPSAIAVQRTQQWDDIRSQIDARRPDPPAHHVRVEELYEAMGVCSLSLKGKISLAHLIEITQALNVRLDKRQIGMRIEIAPEVAGIPSGKYQPRGMA